MDLKDTVNSSVPALCCLPWASSSPAPSSTPVTIYLFINLISTPSHLHRLIYKGAGVVVYPGAGSGRPR